MQNVTIEQCREVCSNKPEFREINKGRYIVFDYLLNDSKTFYNDVSLEMRGIAFCSETGKILSRPYHKFFNYGERNPETKDNIFKNKYTIYEKLDGSMVRTIWFGPGDYVLGTRAGETEYSDMATAWIKQNPERKEKYDNIIEYFCSRGYTLIFEFCSRVNQIVIDYPETDLVLTGIRHNITGEYLDVRDSGLVFDISVVQEWSSEEPAKLISHVKGLIGQEGVIVVGANGIDRVKIKADDYCLKHHAIDAVKFEKNVIRLHIEGKLDDIYPLMVENRRVRISAYCESLNHYINEYVFTLYKARNAIMDGIIRDFGQEIKTNQRFKREKFAERAVVYPKEYRTHLYAIRDIDSPQDAMKSVIIPWIIKHTYSSTKVLTMKIQLGMKTQFYEDLHE